MISADLRWRETARAKLARVEVLAAGHDALGFLVELGELEQGLLDAAYALQDDWGTQDDVLCRAQQQAA
ncbi:MAG: hypothetical protein C4289_08240 [Chloroflexota bacterium]